MKAREFKMRTATSMFMHSVDNRQTAELRPPAIRGVMRYWFRALAGNLMNLGSIRAAEAEVFGSTDTGQRLLVKVTPQIRWQGKYLLLPHKSDAEASKSKSPAINAGQEFRVMLRAVGGNEKLSDHERLDLASWALWLAIHLGGFGQRARRGAGSLRLLDIQPPLVGMAACDSSSLQALQECLKASLMASITFVQQNFPEARPPEGGATGFPILAKEKTRIVVGKLSVKGEQEARKKIMELRDEVDQPTHKNKAFGGIGPRLASPVHMHLQPDASGSFIAVVTWFREPAYGNSTLVDAFLSQIKGTDGLEVSLP